MITLSQRLGRGDRGRQQAAIERVRAERAEDDGEAQAVDADERRQAEDHPPMGKVDQRRAHLQWWQPVLDMMFTDPDQPRPRLYWKNNVRARRNDSPDGVCGVALSGREESIDAFWRAIRRQKAQIERELPEGATVETGRFGIGVMRPNADFRRAWIITNLDHFAKVLGPRMRTLAEKRS
jgi:hypothetical protein